MEPSTNEAANWYYMNGGKLSVPVVIWGIINGGEDRMLNILRSCIPFLPIYLAEGSNLPSTPYDAKGLMISAIKDDNPVLYIDDRWLHDSEGVVPEEIYEVPIGKAVVRREGDDVTLVTTSYLSRHAAEAAVELAKEGVGVEIIDIRTIWM
jgi:pyruvate dehydrogenase E1 component beta subunit